MLSRENIKTILATIALIAILIFSYLATKKESEFNPFTLKLKTPTSSITLNELKENKIVLLYFGFLSCPDACPTTLSKMAVVFKSLPQDKLDKVSFIFVDLDPERDTLVRLQEYASFFHPKIVPVSLALSDLNLFTKFFGIAFMKVPLKSQMGYTIDHSTHIIVLSPKGEIIDHLDHDLTTSMATTKVKKLLDDSFKE